MVNNNYGSRAPSNKIYICLPATGACRQKSLVINTIDKGKFISLFCPIKVDMGNNFPQRTCHRTGKKFAHKIRIAGIARKSHLIL